MRVSQRGQITIPKRLREQFGFDPDVEVEVTPTADGLLVRKCEAEQHPVKQVSGILSREKNAAYGVLSRPGVSSGLKFDSVDEYIEEIRGR